MTADRSRNPGIILLVAVGLMLLFATADSWFDALRAGKSGATLIGAGLAPLISAGLVIVVSLAMPRPPSRRTTAAIVLVVVGLLTAMRRLPKTTPDMAPRLTEDERHGLRVGADSLRHEGLGFALPSPGATFQADDVLQRRLDSVLVTHPERAIWVFKEPGNKRVFIDAAKLPRLDAGQFDRFTLAVRRDAMADETARLVEDSTFRSGSSAEYRLVVRFTAAWLRTRCLGTPRAGHALVVCIATLSARPDELAFVRAGLSVRR